MVFDTHQIDYIIIGLGNKGAEFEATRHNIGATTVNSLAKDFNLTLKPNKKLIAKTATLILPQEKEPKITALLAIPQTFMNQSGKTLKALLKEYKYLDHRKILVIHDELDLKPGQVRVKIGGSHAGHNGVASLYQSVNDKNFIRIRVGIGKPFLKDLGANYVLSKFEKEEIPLINHGIDLAKKAAILIITEGVDKAMNLVNSS